MQWRDSALDVTSEGLLRRWRIDFMAIIDLHGVLWYRDTQWDGLASRITDYERHLLQETRRLATSLCCECIIFRTSFHGTHL